LRFLLSDIGDGGSVRRRIRVHSNVSRQKDIQRPPEI